MAKRKTELSTKQLLAAVNRLGRRGGKGPAIRELGLLLKGHKAHFINALNHYINCPHAEGGINGDEVDEDELDGDELELDIEY